MKKPTRKNSTPKLKPSGHQREPHKVLTTELALTLGKDKDGDYIVHPATGHLRIPIWNLRDGRRLGGRTCPQLRSLNTYLRKRPHCEVFIGQTRETHPPLNGGDNRVPLWDRLHRRKLWGKAAPLQSNLDKYLADNPEYVLYDKQDIIDDGTGRKIIDDSARAPLLLNKKSGKLLGGGARPLRQNIDTFLEKHPDYAVYDSHDEGHQHIVREARKARSTKLIETRTRKAEYERRASRLENEKSESESSSANRETLPQSMASATNLNMNSKMSALTGKKRSRRSENQERDHASKKRDGHEVRPAAKRARIEGKASTEARRSSFRSRGTKMVSLLDTKSVTSQSDNTSHGQQNDGESTTALRDIPQEQMDEMRNDRNTTSMETGISAGLEDIDRSRDSTASYVPDVHNNPTISLPYIPWIGATDNIVQGAPEEELQAGSRANDPPLGEIDEVGIEAAHAAIAFGDPLPANEQLMSPSTGNFHGTWHRSVMHNGHATDVGVTYNQVPMAGDTENLGPYVGDTNMQNETSEEALSYREARPFESEEQEIVAMDSALGIAQTNVEEQIWFSMPGETAGHATDCDPNGPDEGGDEFFDSIFCDVPEGPQW